LHGINGRIALKSFVPKYRMSALDHYRTSASAIGVSAPPQEADKLGYIMHDAFVTIFIGVRNYVPAMSFFLCKYSSRSISPRAYRSSRMSLAVRADTLLPPFPIPSQRTNKTTTTIISAKQAIMNKGMSHMPPQLQWCIISQGPLGGAGLSCAQAADAKATRALP
jgi:hypothetical protein